LFSGVVLGGYFESLTFGEDALPCGSSISGGVAMDVAAVGDVGDGTVRATSET